MDGHFKKRRKSIMFRRFLSSIFDFFHSSKRKEKIEKQKSSEQKKTSSSTLNTPYVSPYVFRRRLNYDDDRYDMYYDRKNYYKGKYLIDKELYDD